MLFQLFTVSSQALFYAVPPPHRVDPLPTHLPPLLTVLSESLSASEVAAADEDGVQHQQQDHAAQGGDADHQTRVRQGTLGVLPVRHVTHWGCAWGDEDHVSELV